MTYKWPTYFWTLPIIASTYGSGAYSGGVYGAGAAAAPTPTPAVTIGPITLPVTGATLAIAGAAMIAVAVGLIYWTYQHRQLRKNALDNNKDGIL